MNLHFLKHCMACALCAAMSCPPIGAQTSLQACYEAAERNFPLARQYGLIEQSLQFTLDNAGKEWLPQLRAEAKAQVQSDVTELPFDLNNLGLAGIKTPHMSKDQYALTAAVEQPLYEGGNIRAQRHTASAEAAAQQQQVRTQLYALRERVNQLYFGILLTQEQERLNAVLQSNLELELRRVEHLKQGGLAHEADLDAVRVEQEKAKQTLIGYQSTRAAYTEMLAALTGVPVEELRELPVPALPPTVPAADCSAPRRPEWQFYALRQQAVEARRESLYAALRPRLNLFAQGGYGRPGLNMLKNDFQLYGVAGLKLTWSLNPWYTRKADRELLRVEQERVETERDVFARNLRLDLAERSHALQGYERQLAHDDEIVRLRENIRRAGQARLEGGTLLAKYAEQGELATAGKPLFKVADMQHLYLRAYVTAPQLTELKLGQSVRVFADQGKEGRKEYRGRLTWIADEAEFTPKTIQTRDERANLVYAVKIAVENDGLIKLGMYGSCVFH